MLVGVTEDAVRQPTLPQAKAEMDLVKLVGFDAIRLSQTWQPGETSLTAAELAPLANAVEAAKLDGIQVLLTVTQLGSRTTPLSDQDQADFAAFAAWLARRLPTVRRFIVSNEPNLNRFWMPQFAEDGTDVAAPAYEQLLARTYDALKAVDPAIEVLGGALAPRGGDKGGGIRPTHSPTVFLQDLAAAYRASGRAAPIMDALAIHPYEDNSSIAPSKGLHPHTTTIALGDYDKLVALLAQAFAGTPQPGAQLPIFYDEFGVETDIPPAEASLYTGTEPKTIHPVDEATQAAYYREALAMSFCEPTVQGISLFHAFDEKERAGWQSGLYYVNQQPKASLAPTRTAIEETGRGVIAHCDGLHLRIHAKVRGSGLRPQLTCDLDCRYVATLVRLPRTVARKAAGVAVGGTPRTLRLSAAHLKPGRYQVRFALRAALNPAPEPLAARGAVFRLP
jgi:hypothetical protein